MKKGLISIFVCMLLILTTISAVAQTKNQSYPMTKGSTLYVGGSGPGNYTTIQDAVNASSDGDTVFVYDDSSPYREHIIINTSISLIGEDKTTTVINGSTDGSDENWTLGFGVLLNAENIVVEGFTIQECNLTGIGVYANNSAITNTILSDNNYGIGIGSRYNIITNNLLNRNAAGIFIESGGYNVISGNIFTQNIIGIGLALTTTNNITHNIISEGQVGVVVIGTYSTVLYRNNISNNDGGVFTYFTSADTILQNNFIGNNKSAETVQMFLIKIELFKKELNFPIRRNIWNGNYWDGPRLLPYVIPRNNFRLSLQIDWHPAQEPYDISKGV
jgi:parallel beta-helix repeat protein